MKLLTAIFALGLVNYSATQSAADIINAVT